MILPQGLVLARDDTFDELKQPPSHLALRLRRILIEISVAGGWTSSRSPTAEDMQVWDKVVKTVNKDLEGLGQPVEVSSQVVAGIKRPGRKPSSPPVVLRGISSPSRTAKR